MAHARDAGTVCHYLMDAVPAGQYSQVDDSSGNGYHLDSVGASTQIVGGKNRAVARYFGGGTAYAATLSDASALRASFLTDYTIMGWVRRDASSGADTFFSVQGTGGGETEAKNILMSFGCDASGNLTTLWEYGAGVNGAVNQVSGAQVVAEEWHHVALKCEFSGGTMTVTLLVDGVQVATGSDSEPTGGTTSPFLVFGVQNAGSPYLDGRLQGWILQDFALSNSAIAAIATLDEPVPDASTLACWQFDELPDFFDLSDNRIHLKRTSGAASLGASPDLNTGTLIYFEALHAEALPLHSAPAILLGEFTIECYVNMIPGQTIRPLGMAGSGDGETTNYIFSPSINASDLCGDFWEYGAGVNVSASGVTPIANRATVKHLAIRRYQSGSNWYEDFLLDGVVHETIDFGVNAPTGGTAASLGIPHGDGTTETAAYGDLILYDYKRTDSQILADAQDLGHGSPDATPPAVTNFSPAAGSQITKTTPVGFDVTDDYGTFARIMVVVWFKDTGIHEVVHDGDSFVGAYSAASSRILIANGFRYSVLRSGGWPSAPTIRVFPIDAVGNQP